MPLTLLLVFLLLYLNTRSVIETCIVLLAVPFSLIGAVWLLYLLDYNMSVAVWVGLIALAGLDAETGVIMLLYLTLSHRRHAAEGRLRTPQDLEDAIVEGAAKRIRPKLMTVLTTDDRPAAGRSVEHRHRRRRHLVFSFPGLASGVWAGWRRPRPRLSGLVPLPDADRRADGGRARPQLVLARAHGLPGDLPRSGSGAASAAARRRRDPR